LHNSGNRVNGWNPATHTLHVYSTHSALVVPVEHLNHPRIIVSKQVASNVVGIRRNQHGISTAEGSRAKVK
jgi:hypothetical protein